MLINQMKTRYHYTGFSLVELMIAMVVGLFVAAIVATMYVSIIRANSVTIQLARLNQDLEATLDIMSRDIQRTGYVSGAQASLSRNVSGAPANATIFNTVSSATFSAFTVVSGALTANPKDLITSGDNCILLRYDANGDGSISGNNPPEVIAYRYNLTSHSIEYQAWSSVANQSCSATSGWAALAGGDGHMSIQGLRFAVLPASGASPTNWQRSIEITVSGSSTTDSNLDVTLRREVRLRNDQFTN